MKNYKITTDIRDFVLQKAREQPGLGCRKVSWLIQEQFQLNISKSSIAAILKAEGLSKAAGRPRTRPFPEPSLRGVSPPQAADEEAISTEILSLKFVLEDQTVFFLDAGFQTIWPTSRIPSGFSRGMDKLRQELERDIILNQEPLILLAAPGFQEPSSVFLSFLASLQGEDAQKAIKSIELYTKDGQLLETIEPALFKKRHFLIGLWPWQYQKAACPSFLRKVVRQKDGQAIFTVLTNMDETLAKDEEILQLYFNRWPEPEKSYQELLSKITQSCKVRIQTVS